MADAETETEVEAAETAHFVLKMGAKHSCVVKGEHVHRIGDGQGTIELTEGQAKAFKDKLVGEGEAKAVAFKTVEEANPAGVALPEHSVEDASVEEGEALGAGASTSATAGTAAATAVTEAKAEAAAAPAATATKK